ncbi:hypothetical protein [Micromonospora sp. CPCC 205561]|uniref:hypothetical protein n=1 Tax=Micromonospora sp. CPCC 205561 TaxID=3122407 RepID=UPI002FF39030
MDFEFRSILVYLTIRNIGTTIARDVRITFDKKLESSLGKDSELNDSPLFREPIPMIAPGRKISVLFDSYNSRAGDKELPMQYTVTLKYRDTDGKRHVDPPYPLDLAMYEGSSLEPKGIPELVDEVQKARKTMEKWTQGIKGLRVHTIDHEKYENRNVRPHILRHAGQVRREKGWLGLGRWALDRQLRIHGWKR